MRVPRPADALLDRDLIGLLSDLGEGSGVRFLSGLYESFAGDARRTLEQMRELARRGDGAGLAREAHRLVGSSGSIGAAEFARECREIERRARAVGTAELEVAIDHAWGHLEATVRALRSVIGRRRGAGRQAPDA